MNQKETQTRTSSTENAGVVRCQKKQGNSVRGLKGWNKMQSIVWEVIMKNKTGRIWNGFFSTLQDAERLYREYVSLDWSGDVFRREVDYD
jgi:hypothetical protein